MVLYALPELDGAIDAVALGALSGGDVAPSAEGIGGWGKGGGAM